MASRISIYDLGILRQALIASVIKLEPRHQFKNPVIFSVYVGALITLVLYFQTLYSTGDAPRWFIFWIMVWLWATILFSNFAESVAEGRGKAQARALRSARKEIQAKKLHDENRTAEINFVPSASLKKNDIVLVEAGDIIPSDGEVIEGVASVDESAITGESAPVIRESGGDRSAVTGGTKVISDWLVVRVSANSGETFLDHMIDLVEGAKRQKTPNELALTILLCALTFMFLLVCATLLPFSLYSLETSGGQVVSLTILIALFVCLAPTTIGALLSAIGIAGMDRMTQANIIALSGRSIEVAGDVDVLLLDKTGTITLGNRQAVEFIPDDGVDLKELALDAALSSLSDDTAEGRSILMLAQSKYHVDTPDKTLLNAKFIPFTAETRISGIALQDKKILKGSPEAIKDYLEQSGAKLSRKVEHDVEQVSVKGGTPLIVVNDTRVLGVVYLKDVIKKGIKERFVALRRMGIKTIMMTGDNPLTAATIAGEAGVDDYLASAKPEEKLNYIRKLQSEGHIIAMTGDGSNDAPALAQADVGVAMNTGTQAAKEASNLVDLDSDPTKLIEVIEIGKQLLITRGSLTTFSIANDVAKYFAILPAAFASTYPQLEKLNLMNLSTPHNAILAAVIFNALVIVLLIPLALHGVKYKPVTAVQLLRKNVLVYGVGGLILPFIGIKIIDQVINRLG